MHVEINGEKYLESSDKQAEQHASNKYEMTEQLHFAELKFEASIASINILKWNTKEREHVPEQIPMLRLHGHESFSSTTTPLVPWIPNYWPVVRKLMKSHLPQGTVDREK